MQTLFHVSPKTWLLIAYQLQKKSFFFFVCVKVQNQILLSVLCVKLKSRDYHFPQINLVLKNVANKEMYLQYKWAFFIAALFKRPILFSFLSFDELKNSFFNMSLLSITVIFFLLVGS